MTLDEPTSKGEPSRKGEPTTTVTYRTSPKKNNVRSHSATVGIHDQGVYNKLITLYIHVHVYKHMHYNFTMCNNSLKVYLYSLGIAMFHKRAQDTSIEPVNNTSNIRQLLLTDVESLNSIEKSTLAETLREVEMERHLASEER